MGLTTYNGPGEAELIKAKIHQLEASMEDWGAKWNAMLARMEKKQAALENDKDLELLGIVMSHGYMSNDDLVDKFKLCKKLLENTNDSA